MGHAVWPGGATSERTRGSRSRAAQRPKGAAQVFYGLFYGRGKILLQNYAILRNAVQIGLGRNQGPNSRDHLADLPGRTI